MQNTIKGSGKMTLTFDTNVYNNLLAEFSPKAIETEEEYDRALKVAEKLTFTKNQTPEVQAFYKLLVTLIEVYETEHYPIPDTTPLSMLEHLMDARDTTPEELGEILGSLEIALEILRGDRIIYSSQAKTLGAYFHVNASLFM